MTGGWDSDEAYDADNGDDRDASLDFLAVDHQPAAIENHDTSEISFIAADPAGITTVTASLDGEIQRIDLAPKACEMIEAELADRILRVADVVTMKSRAGLNEFVSGLMLLQGQDRDSVRDIVEHHMGLPTPEQAMHAEAALATSHRPGDD